ncbi:MAG TPA: Mur ligase family protein [Polyangia bacterium]|jgi:dihydrofolate synthase/folylpolyglutamate synthase|nr:Mur ligase family protein [Polyangia bacterium]
MGARYPDLLARLDSVRTLGVDLGLDRVREALRRLGAPEDKFPAVQIAGTNGKGSTAAMTDAILRAAGWKTGLFTSPHLSRFTERIRAGDVEADGDRLAALDLRIVATSVPLTYFEVSTVLAFLLMAEESVDLAVLETGLGGRLDAVTTCRPVATAVTSIAFDHMDYLGTDLRSIAREKAGVIKPGVPHFIGRLPAVADEEMQKAAARVGAPLRRLGVDFFPAKEPVGLAGLHQRDNAGIARALAIAAGAALGRPIGEAALAAGLGAARWPGRLERIAADVLLDCAHNPEGAAALAAALPALASGRRLALVVSVVKDKDVAGVLAPLTGAFDLIIATASHNPRALPAAALAAALPPGPPSLVIPEARAALAEARQRMAAVGGLVVVAGSIFLVGEVRAALCGETTDPTPLSDPV